MAEWFASWAGETLISKLLVTFFVAMLPIVELRGALPLGVSIGLEPWTSLAASLVGNMLPVPFIILFIRRVFDWLQTRSKWLNKLVQRRVEKTLAHQKSLYRSEILGLIVLVAIPLPGTGAWTGALLAALLGIRLRVAVPAILIGVVAAGVLVMGITLGFTSIFA